MDISEQYVRMCEKAVEVQELAMLNPPLIGRYVFGGDFCFDENDRLWVSDDEVWLPRQDQLQKLLPIEYIDSFSMFAHLVRWAKENDDYLEDAFAGNESPEQLWLAFVMKEKFNKTWNGEDWA